MENASIALIIAGAVLIAILLISLGVAIFQKASQIQEPVISATETMAVATFNSQFTNYLGTNLSSVQIKMLLSRIIANNSNSSDDKEVYIKWIVGESGNRISPQVLMSEIVVGAKYNAVINNTDARLYN